MTQIILVCKLITLNDVAFSLASERFGIGLFPALSIQPPCLPHRTFPRITKLSTLRVPIGLYINAHMFV